MRPQCRMPKVDRADIINMSTPGLPDWVVWWEGDIIAHTDTLSAAKTIAKYWNKALAQLSKATTVSSLALSLGLQNFCNNASIGTGFDPVIPMT